MIWFPVDVSNIYELLYGNRLNAAISMLGYLVLWMEVMSGQYSVGTQ